MRKIDSTTVSYAVILFLILALSYFSYKSHVYENVSETLSTSLVSCQNAEDEYQRRINEAENKLSECQRALNVCIERKPITVIVEDEKSK